MEHRSLFGSLSVANGGAFGISFGLERHMVILIGYRHGLPASELCDLQWSQVELATGRLHVRRAKNGSPSVHPMQGARYARFDVCSSNRGRPRTSL